MAQRSTLETLGKFQLKIYDRLASPPPTNKARALLAYLIANRGHDVARERLIDMFWPEFEPERAREGLRTALSSIRHSLRTVDSAAVDLLSTNKSVAQWAACTEYDADRFVELAQSDSMPQKQEALKLYRGDFLEGNYEEWAVRERERLSAVYESALAATVSATDDPDAARLLLLRNPYNENAYAALIETEIEASRPENAAALLSRCRAAMAEGGFETSAAFEERFAAVFDAPTQSEGIVVPFVARTAELELLQRSFKEHAGHDGFVALIIGEPGIGKTALGLRAEEIARQADLRTLTIRCSEDPKQLSAWRSLYERLTRKKLDDLAATSSDVVAAVAREIVQAFGKPCVLFVDDAHLLTGDSLATLHKVLEIARPAGHGVVILLRPEARNRIEALVSAYSHDTVVLRPLERSDIEAALTLTVEGAGSELAGVLYERSGGHPLFFIALLQSLVQKRALRMERGRWHVVRALDERLELPADLRASIDVRLRAAGDDAAVVACALALEPSSTAEDIAAALDYAEPRVLDALDRLMGFSLISEAPVGGGFRFIHDIVREVSAAILNPGRRVALHRAFARRFERSSQPEATVRLARHLRAAGLAILAASAYAKAARAALARYAIRDAADHCVEGIRALARVEPSAESDALLAQLYRVYARAAAHSGEFESAGEAADQAVQHARAHTQTIEMVKSLLVRAALHGIAGDSGVQLSDASEASVLAVDAGEPGLSLRAAVEAAAATRAKGNVDEAMRLAVEAAEAAERCKDAPALFAAFDELLNAQICWWRFQNIETHFRDARPVAESIGSTADAKISCLRAAYAYLSDRSSDAVSEVRAALRRIEPQRLHREAPRESSYLFPLPLVAFTAQYLSGILACARSKWDEALEAAIYCNEVHALIRLPRYASAVIMLQIDALLGRNFDGDFDRALRLAESLPDVTPDGIIGWSDCKALVSARLAVRGRGNDVRAPLRAALDALEEHAKAVPLDSDRAFARLGAAAEAARDFTIRDRALARAAYYRGLRLAALVVRTPEAPYTSGVPIHG